MDKITLLIEERNELQNQLNKLVYGSVEIRNTNNKSYLYTHYRNEGVLLSRYVGEYSDVLHNLILNNDVLAKSIKKRLKEINKELIQFNYVDSGDIDEKVAMNIDLAKRYLVDSIYKQSILEGIATTYSDTASLIEGGKANNMTASDISKIINLKRAWEFIISKDMMSYPTNYATLCQINSIVEDGFNITAGRIRTVAVAIGGSTYIPPIPFEEEVRDELSSILKKETGIDLAVELVLYVMKRQLFLDGNKRTAVLFANHYLVSHALGLLVVPADCVNEYKKILVDYYEDEAKKEKISFFLKNKCWIKMK